MEMGEYYKNEKGEMLHILTFLKTKAFGPTYIAEYLDSRAESMDTCGIVKIIPVNIKDLESENWTNIKEEEFTSKISLKGNRCTNYL
jgi:hypothetical protein